MSIASLIARHLLKHMVKGTKYEIYSMAYRMTKLTLEIVKHWIPFWQSTHPLSSVSIRS